MTVGLARRTTIAVVLLALAVPAAAPSGPDEPGALLEHDPRTVLPFTLERLAAARASGDPAAISAALSDLALVRIELGEYEEALGLAERALDAAREGRDAALEALARAVRGDARFYLDDHDGAIEEYRAGLEIGRRTGDPSTEAAALKNLGIVYRATNRPEEALDLLERSIELFRVLGQDHQTSSALEAMGDAYARLGDDPQALNVFGEALEIGLRTGNERLSQQVLIQRGSLYLAHGLPGPAREDLERALPMVERMRLPLNELQLRTALAVSLAGLRRFEEAIAMLRSAIELTRELGLDHHLGSLLLYLGEFHLDADPETGLAYMRQALDSAIEHDAVVRWPFHVGLATAWERLDRLDLAVEHYARALEHLESDRAAIVSPRFRVTFLHKNQAVYRQAIDALLDLSEQHARDVSRETLEIFERAKARGLLETLSRASPQSEPAAAGAAASAPFSLERARASLDEQTALVAYCVTPQRVVVFLLTAGSLDSWPLGAGPDRLEPRVRNYLDLLSEGEEAGWRVLGRRLEADLVAPVRERLPRGVRNLILVPDAFLHLLPFETLLLPPGDDGRAPHLIEKFAVAYAPSVSVLARLARADDLAPDAARADLLMLAHPEHPRTPPEVHRDGAPARLRAFFENEGLTMPPLPWSLAESRAIEPLAGPRSRILTGAEASEQRLKREPLEPFRIVHFATHGLVSETLPLRSSLLLAPSDDPSAEDGFLEAREVYGLKLRSDLVVLSACRTARGRILSGEGVQGLAHAFLHAGSRAVLASLWSVDDRMTARLMATFYERLAEGLPVAEALRQAKLSMLRDPSTAAPRSWAPFVVIGAASAPIALEGPPWWRRSARWVWPSAVVALLCVAWLLLRARLRAA